LVQVKSKKGLRNPTIKLDRRLVETSKTPTRPLPDNAAAKEPYLVSSRRQQVVERQYSPNAKTIMLGNVTVKGRAQQSDPRRIYGQPDVVIKTKDIPAASSYTNILQLLQGRVAGVMVSGNPIDMQVQIRGQGTPLFVVDGIPMSDASFVNTIPVTDVESVEVLKGPSAAIYGSRGGGGVIAIFTKRGNPDYDYSNDPPSPSMQSYRMPRYYQARQFYAPAYTNNRNANIPDFRSATLYWNPTIRTDASGQTTVSFYTSDEGGPFRLTLEGLSVAGSPGHGTGAFQVVK